MENDIATLEKSGDVLFMMFGAVMVFAMHGGFAFLEVGTVRKKNQVNALVKLIADFSFVADLEGARERDRLGPADSLPVDDRPLRSPQVLDDQTLRRGGQ